MSKYELLWQYIEKTGKDGFKLSFEEIKNVLGFDMDHSFLNCKKELSEYGYEVSKISIKEKYVLINKKK
ncbi:MAG: hypothetical protein J6036_00250 [Clostridia bacterium]|nr:hypothetical protein [Clostridia bacterium]